MSTIATDGICIAADTLMNGGGYVTGTSEKLFKTDQGVFGTAGIIADCLKFKEWIEANQPQNPTYKFEDFQALWLKPNGTVWQIDTRMVWIEQYRISALGTGDQLALGAMLHGASPRQAVEIAMMRDTRTGGDIRVVYV